MMKRLLTGILAIVLGGLTMVVAQAAEPTMTTYESFPVFTVNPVKPNILIILDNSGSMNFNAYGSYPGDGGTVTDEPYAGVPYKPAFEVRVSGSSNDAEQNITTGAAVYYNHTDLDLGRFSTNGQESNVGLRFQNIQVPPGSTITNAYIEFTALGDNTGNMTVSIAGENVDDAATFAATTTSISSRTKTSQVVNWTPVNWVSNGTYQTDELKTIVQAIVDRAGWMSGNDMAFIFSSIASSLNKRDAYAYDQDAAKAPKLHIEYTQATNTKYYGYFNPDWYYSYASNKFSHKYKKIGYATAACPASWEVMTAATVTANGSATQCLSDATIVSEAIWDGNWMNWATMRRVDVARKVMMGGKASSRTGGGNQTLYGETPAQTSRTFKRKFNSTVASAVTPYDSNKMYGLEGGYLYVDMDGDDDPFDNSSNKFNLAIGTNQLFEPEIFVNGNISGVLQKVGEDKAWWGNEFFYSGTGNNQEGGRIVSPIGTNMTSLITDLQNTGCDTWTPLGEAYYVAMQYFKQEQADGTLGYAATATAALNNTNDPYYQKNNAFVPCSKSFVILLTDGASTKDARIPAYLKDTDGDGDLTTCDESDGNPPCDYPSGGTDFLDDVALYARTHDLRMDLAGDQNMMLYTIYAFGQDQDARDLLRDAAKNGGFVDKNGNNLPDLTAEWDSNNDGDPDTYFEASNGYRLEAKILAAINDILKRAASGTAVSVLATSSEGEGNLVQAYFRPAVTDGLVDTKWLGYLQSLWVDSKGYLREDTNGNNTLDIGVDKPITYEIDASGNTVVNKFSVSVADPYPDLATDIPQKFTLADILPIWEAGDVLTRTAPADRKIFTSIEGAAPVSLFGGVKFNNDTVALRDFIKPFLGVKDATAWSYLGTTHADRAQNLIHFIRGNDSGFAGTSNIRQRAINGTVWRLGDIVNSTPVAVAVPPDNYGLIYSDQSYDEFYRYHTTRTDRETAVYVGANDGMLHAFTSWQYDAEAKEFKKPSGAGLTEEIGAELWSYVPRALLPHLKWLANPDYSHVYYVDLKPKVIDAKIFYKTLGDPASGVIDATYDATYDVAAYHKNGWGTVLVGGLRLGGKAISVTDDFDYNAGTADTSKTFTTSYFAIDVSNPRVPKLLWEKTYSGMNFNVAEPAVLKVGEKWFLTFGSGPDTFDGTSTSNAHVFVVDLATGTPYKNGANDWLFEASENKAFMSGPASLDKGLNYNTDAAYFGEAYEAGAGWDGALYKLTIPWKCTVAGCDYGDTTKGAYIADPLDATMPWTLRKIFSSPEPITATPSLSVDYFDNAWIYFGTGRYFSMADKSTTTTQYLFGIKDPFFNKPQYSGTYFHDYATSKTLTAADLFDSDAYKVIYPWGCDQAPAGDCSAVPAGQVGDIYSDGSCVCSYAWPSLVCTPVNPADQALCDSFESDPTKVGDPDGTGRCVCVAYVAPIWGCVAKVAGGCDGVPQGVVADTATYKSLYWRATPSTDGACESIPFGTVGSFNDSTTPATPAGTTCVTVEAALPPYNCVARPAGNCLTIVPPVVYGDEGDMSKDGGSCTCGWFTVADGVVNGCNDLNFSTLTTVLNFPDLQGDGSCLGTIVAEPEAVVTDVNGLNVMSFTDLLALARVKDGWKRVLPLPKERALSKPSLLGGLALFTTYVPNQDVCSFGGESYLYALYFETGTPYKKPVFSGENATETIGGMTVIRHRLRLGLGMASSVGIHVGQQEGGKATGYVQQSTGAILQLDLDPAFNIRSGFISWEEQ